MLLINLIFIVLKIGLGSALLFKYYTISIYMSVQFYNSYTLCLGVHFDCIYYVYTHIYTHAVDILNTPAVHVCMYHY